MATADELNPALSSSTARKAAHDEISTTLIRVARQSVVPPNTPAQVLITTLLSKLLEVQAHLECLYRRKKLTARKAMGIVHSIIDENNNAQFQ